VVCRRWLPPARGRGWRAGAPLPTWLVPAVLSSGNHKAIEQARAKDGLLLTRRHRPDLFVKRRRKKGEAKLLDDERVASLAPAVVDETPP
jgi:tRNA G37 N-methylase TrmD